MDRLNVRGYSNSPKGVRGSFTPKEVVTITGLCDLFLRKESAMTWLYDHTYKIPFFFVEGLDYVRCKNSNSTIYVQSALDKIKLFLVKREGRLKCHDLSGQ